MRNRWLGRFFCSSLMVLICHSATAQWEPETLQIYTDHPRLFLRPPRLKLLRRERERQSMRWEQFRIMVEGGAPFPEPGLAYALAYQITGSPSALTKAIASVSQPGADLRQEAIVFDWCADHLNADQKHTLVAALRAGLQSPPRTLGEFRSGVLAAVALAGEDDTASQKFLAGFFKSEWKEHILGGLSEGKERIANEDTYALMEIFHVVRDNLHVDLRESFPAFFKQLPLYDLLSYYPAPYPAAENEFHIPYSSKIGEPDLAVAALSRAGELAMVGFDSNAPESQVLQGWLMNDRFQMRGLLGAPYEFLWANPYQPGLSYYHVPLVLHDEILGRLLVRSSWEDDARWAGFINGKLQEFRDGRVAQIDAQQLREPLNLEEATIAYAPTSNRFQASQKDVNDVFLVGLAPRSRYHVEAEDEEMREATADPGGILYFPGLRSGLAVRFKQEAVSGDSRPSTNP